MSRVISSAQSCITKFILPFVVVAVLAYGISLAGTRVVPLIAPAGVMVIASIYWYYVGASIIFMPKFRFLWPGQEHPIAQELRDLMLENRVRP